MNDAYLAKAMEKVPDKRALILLASKRAKQLAKGERPLIKHSELDFLDVALLEIGEGLLSYELPNTKQSDGLLD
ncbi:MAG TPA: DNA-directed RNA polymerase subunit omega [Lentisphaeria bacterium]|nr:MAG: DNA-directed RNA polymerase subunit omega [Lentisphaerae bacterium GWF2_38_69]HBM17066.1 DNA-directed RNA polymerase subunit omega [Lentisphaeria bacterium]